VLLFQAMSNISSLNRRGNQNIILGEKNGIRGRVVVACLRNSSWER